MPAKRKEWPDKLIRMRDSVSRICDLLSANIWFSYVSIVLLQLKLIWEVWRVRDLTAGDTSYYFLTAYSWFKRGETLITWSPLYTSFYGAFLHLSSDAVFVTMAHRMATVLILAVLVLAVMRRFLPNSIAWLMAVWWVILPIDFDAMFEVHLFGLIPLLVTILIASSGTRLRRGCGLAGLLASGLLMRNEMLLAAAGFGAVAFFYELRQIRSEGLKPGTRELLLKYGLPVVAVLLLTGFFYSRATDPPVLRSMISRKHSLNMCQTYAFGYQQRHTEWTQSPWTECQALMTKQFGAEEPSLMGALAANPSAMMEHFGWNVILIPNGLQMLLFDRMFGSMNPDYGPSKSGSLLAGGLSLLLLTVLIAGGVSLATNDRRTLNVEMNLRAWGWVVLACLSAVTAMVIVMQRPRPSYMFPLGIAIRVISGFCLVALLRHFGLLTRFERLWSVLAMLFVVFTPGYYASRPSPAANSLSTVYERLRPFEGLFEVPDVKFSAVIWIPEICNYLTKTVQGCKTAPYTDVTRRLGGSLTLGKALKEEGVNLFYADESVISDPAGREFVTDPSKSGWIQLAFEDLPGRRWMLLKRDSWQKQSESSLAEIIHKGQGISLGAGWYGFETFRGDNFRWANNDANIQVSGHEEELGFLVLDVEPGPGLERPLRFHILSEGKDLATVAVLGRQSIKVPLGSTSGADPRIFRLHVDGQGKPTPTDSRILNFRVFNIELAAK